MTKQFPLREQRKAATRRELIDAAQKLFMEKGYNETTLEEIAAHAGLHVQTLYRHFSNKIELATAGNVELLERFRVAIRDPKRTNNTFEFWRRWVRDITVRVTAKDGGRLYREFLHQQWGPPLISSQLIRNAQEYVDLLAESFARDFVPDPDAAVIDPARLAAIALWGANGHVLRRYANEPDVDLVLEAVTAVDPVESLFMQYLPTNSP